MHACIMMRNKNNRKSISRQDQENCLKEEEISQSQRPQPDKIVSSSFTSSIKREVVADNNKNNEDDDDIIKLIKEKSDDTHDNNNDNNNLYEDNEVGDVWKNGDWCWERNYEKYPVIFPSRCSNNDDDEKKLLAATSVDDNDERKPAATSASVSKNNIGDDDDEEDDKDDEDDEDDEDDTFYDDWVEGDWGWVRNYNNDNAYATKKSAGFRNTGSNNDKDGNTIGHPRSIPRKRKRKRRNDEDELQEDDEDNTAIAAVVQDRGIKRLRDKSNWEQMFQRLVDYKKHHKHTMVTRNENPQLGIWVQTQRRICRNGNLLESRLTILNSIGFVWNDPRSTKRKEYWMKMFQRLVTYNNKQKSTLVPLYYKEDPSLGRWVSWQRCVYNKNALLEERFDLLDSIGFVWEDTSPLNNADNWMKTYQRLVTYNNKHKSTLVPRNYKEDPSLGRWVSWQRCLYSTNALLEERFDLLDSIGFVWEDTNPLNNQDNWMKTYQRLVTYKNEHKSTLVPCNYKEDPSLGNWVRTQRNYFRNNKLLKDRFDLLESIGFVWNAQFNWFKK